MKVSNFEFPRTVRTFPVPAQDGMMTSYLEICSGLDVAIREFFHHASDADLLEYCISLNLQKKKLLIVERLVETGLEAKKEYRELISKALLYLFQQEYLTQNDIACGFCVSHQTFLTSTIGVHQKTIFEPM